jgi:hypothetical protein
MLGGVLRFARQRLDIWDVVAARSEGLHGYWLLRALCAAAVSCQMKLEVFFSIIVSKLFASLDCAEGEDIQSTITDPDLAIRSAGVVDEASDICRNVSVDHAHVTRPEEVLPAIFRDLFGCGAATQVFGYE